MSFLVFFHIKVHYTNDNEHALMAFSSYGLLVDILKMILFCKRRYTLIMFKNPWVISATKMIYINDQPRRVRIWGITYWWPEKNESEIVQKVLISKASPFHLNWCILWPNITVSVFCFFKLILSCYFEKVIYILNGIEKIHAAAKYDQECKHWNYNKFGHCFTWPKSVLELGRKITWRSYSSK